MGKEALMIFMVQQKLSITNRFEKKLEILLRKPSEEGKFPAVLLVSGFGMDLHENKNSNDEISQRLVKAGYLTVQFNFSVVGTGRELSLDNRANELIDVWKWMCGRPDVESKRTGIYAISFGTITVLQARPEHLVSTVFVSGVYDRAERFKQEFVGRGATILYDNDTELPRSFGKTVVGPEFWPNLDRFDPINQAKKVTTPIFLIHGDKDPKIETLFVQKFYSAIASKKKKLKIFHGGDHGIASVPRPMREEFLTDVVNWFEKTLSC